MRTAGILTLGALGAGLAYVLFAPKPRFLGDKLEKGDRATVDVRTTTPEFMALLPAGTPGTVVFVVRELAKDTFTGDPVAISTPGGEVPVPAPAQGLARTLPRSGVVAIQRGTRNVTL